MPVKYEPWSVRNGKQDLWGIKLLEGEFAGTTISINSVEMDDKSDDGTVALDFNFIQRPKGKTEEDLNSAEFNGVIADIINDILAKAINEFENRTGDSAKPGNR
jgi:hypothetical protein